MGRAKLKNAFRHAQNAQIQIILRIRALAFLTYIQ